VEDGPAISVTTAQMIGCTATLSWMLHDHDITDETIIPAWYGERLDLDHAIYTCFVNAEYDEKARQREREEARGREHQAQAA
jgi:hypothetical protein